MNSFVAARQAIEATRNHVCNSRCPRTSAGLCQTRIKLWDAQHAACAAWNAPATTEVPPEDSVPVQTDSDADRGYL